MPQMQEDSENGAVFIHYYTMTRLHLECFGKILFADKTLAGDNISSASIGNSTGDAGEQSPVDSCATTWPKAWSSGNGIIHVLSFYSTHHYICYLLKSTYLVYRNLTHIIPILR
jgi:hypothetical protein